MKFNRREDLARQCEGEDRKQRASAQYALYHKKKAELDRAAQEFSDELLAEVDKFTLKAPAKKNAGDQADFLLERQKRMIADIIRRSQPDIDLMVAILQNICESWKDRKPSLKNAADGFDPEFIRQLEAVLPETDEGEGEQTAALLWPLGFHGTL